MVFFCLARSNLSLSKSGFFQLSEHLEGLLCGDALVECDAVVGGKDPADSVGAPLLVVPNMVANSFRIDVGERRHRTEGLDGHDDGLLALA